MIQILRVLLYIISLPIWGIVWGLVGILISGFAWIVLVFIILIAGVIVVGDNAGEWIRWWVAIGDPVVMWGGRVGAILGLIIGPFLTRHLEKEMRKTDVK